MTPPPIVHIIVTGATGYIGSRLVRIASAQRRAVTALSRSGAEIADGSRYLRWQLGDPLPSLDLPAKATALIHLAHDWRDHDTNGSNVGGSKALLRDARTLGLKRFVFVSSQSARIDALNAYGRIKWTIEQFLDGPDTVAARVGLVYGGALMGMYGLLAKLAAVSPLLPMVDPGRSVQPIHVDEVCRGLLALADGSATGWIGLAGPEPISFGDFLKTLAREGFSSSLQIFPMPLRLALFIADASAAIPLAPRIDKERILGLAGTQPMDCRTQLEALGIAVMPARWGLRQDPIGRKALLSEARVLGSFVAGKRPSGTFLRRYLRAVRAVEQEPGPVLLPRLALWRPGLLRLFEPLGGSSGLRRRLHIATALAEFSSDDCETAGLGSDRGRFAKLWSILVLAIAEVAAIPCRLLFARRS
jgi:nucleoside-diphosphate-sugar epimerase